MDLSSHLEDNLCNILGELDKCTNFDPDHVVSEISTVNGSEHFPDREVTSDQLVEGNSNPEKHHRMTSELSRYIAILEPMSCLGKGPEPVCL